MKAPVLALCHKRCSARVPGEYTLMRRLVLLFCLCLGLSLGVQAQAAGKKGARPNPKLITAPAQPTQAGGWWAFYLGTMKIDASPYYDPHGINYQWAYSRKTPLPENPKVVVYMHGSGGGVGAMHPFGPSPKGDIEVRTQDAETYNQFWREWWMFGPDGKPYPGRRIAAALNFIQHRYGINMNQKGIVLEGPSMGGAGAVVQTMILPGPWRKKIAYSSGRVGVIMPRRVAARAPAQYAGIPPDKPPHRALWDRVDFSIRAASDPIVRGIHYRHIFSTGDQFSRGPAGNTQTEFVNLVEKHRIGGAFTWVKGDHVTYEPGVNFPDLAKFEVKEQDVTLDRAHPAITRSTGNYPFRARDRVSEEKFPRGHYNMGIHWHHARIVDTRAEIVFPLKYQHRMGLGKGIPDQPARIKVNVTPRRPRNFVLKDGETLKWSWDGGALSGESRVFGDTLIIKSIPLVSGEGYKNLRIYR